MNEITLEPGWLERQIKATEREREFWANWFQGEKSKGSNMSKRKWEPPFHVENEPYNIWDRYGRLVARMNINMGDPDVYWAECREVAETMAAAVAERTLESKLFEAWGRLHILRGAAPPYHERYCDIHSELLMGERSPELLAEIEALTASIKESET